MVTLVMLPWMIPNTLQTEKLLEPGDIIWVTCVIVVYVCLLVLVLVRLISVRLDHQDNANNDINIKYSNHHINDKLSIDMIFV